MQFQTCESEVGMAALHAVSPWMLNVCGVQRGDARRSAGGSGAGGDAGDALEHVKSSSTTHHVVDRWRAHAARGARCLHTAWHSASDEHLAQAVAAVSVPVSDGHASALEVVVEPPPHMR